MLKYTYMFCGDFYKKKLQNGKFHDDLDGYNYSIEVPIPIKYDSVKDAKGCNCSLQFEVEDGHVVLRVYDGWEQGMKDGKWIEHVDGNVIDTIRWEEHWKYKMARSKGGAKEMEFCTDMCLDYVPDATPWDDLFDIKNQPEGWCCTVESLAYSLSANDDTWY